MSERHFTVNRCRAAEAFAAHESADPVFKSIRSAEDVLIDLNRMVKIGAAFSAVGLMALAILVPSAKAAAVAMGLIALGTAGWLYHRNMVDRRENLDAFLDYLDHEDSGAANHALLETLLDFAPEEEAEEPVSVVVYADFPRREPAPGTA